MGRFFGERISGGKRTRDPVIKQCPADVASDMAVLIRMLSDVVPHAGPHMAVNVSL
jgi:hypothetical protein